jgi:WD40 repeat protein
MVMAVAIFYQAGRLTVVAGYEGGHTMVSQEIEGRGWQILYLCQSHAQPVLSLDLAPDQSFYVTSSADAIIAKHPVPSPRAVPQGSSNVPTAKGESRTPRPNQNASGLSQLLAEGSAAKGSPETVPQPKQGNIERQITPLKISQTKHAGQQGIKMRSDSKIFATAGWDSRVRVYSAQSLKELAVLKWHKEGCYALAFAKINTEEQSSSASKTSGSEVARNELVSRTGTSLSVKEKRLLKASTAHWLAAGSKDGKVSLWDIY